MKNSGVQLSPGNAKWIAVCELYLEMTEIVQRFLMKRQKTSLRFYAESLGKKAFFFGGIWTKSYLDQLLDEKCVDLCFWLCSYHDSDSGSNVPIEGDQITTCFNLMNFLGSHNNDFAHIYVFLVAD